MAHPNLTQIVPQSLLFPTRRCILLHACVCGYFGDPLKPCTCSPGRSPSVPRQDYGDEVIGVTPGICRIGCPRIDIIRLWPLPIMQPWFEDWWDDNLYNYNG